MIPPEHIAAWRVGAAPWRLDRQVEQDLILSRALVEMFATDEVAGGMALRGGAALHKLRSQSISTIGVAPQRNS